jgi:hypothetical protein
MTGPTQSTTVQDVRVVITPGTSAPNVIPVGGRVPNQHVNILPYQQQQQQQLLHQHQQQQHHQGNDQYYASVLMALMVYFCRYLFRGNGGSSIYMVQCYFVDIFVFFFGLFG